MVRQVIIPWRSLCGMVLGAALTLVGSSASAEEPPRDDAVANEPAIEYEPLESPFEDHLETDRDSFTPSTRTANQGRWILESAYSFIDQRRTPEKHSLPELVLRYGVTERLELRVGWNYEVGAGSNVVSAVEAEEAEGPRIEQEHAALYGLKARVTDQSNWIPESSFILQAFTPTGGPATSTDLAVTYVFGWEFYEDWKLDSAIRFGTDSEEGDHFTTWSPSTVLKVPVTERWHAHLEYFGHCPHGAEFGGPRYFVSPGVHYLVTRDLEIGVRVGWGLNDASARFFSNAGLGWRF